LKRNTAGFTKGGRLAFFGYFYENNLIKLAGRKAIASCINEEP